MSEEQVVHFVRIALEARASGQVVDLAELCSDHPELIDAVRESLSLRGRLPAPGHADPLLGEVLDERYRLEEVIGAGAMGVVYGATDRSLERAVAVKVLQPGVLATPERRERFVREARVLASLDHPNIVAIHDHGSTGGALDYLVMERLFGVSLATVLEHAGHRAAKPRGASAVADAGGGGGDWLRDELGVRAAPSEYIPRVVTWTAQLASALAAAHDAGSLHRDLKPSNVFVTTDGRAVLLDFGIAARAGDGSLTAGGTTLGTPSYMAPEQVESVGPPSPSIDVYGLCATLYHLVTFRPPYQGDYAQVLARLRLDDPVPPARVRPELPRDLCAIIEKGMEREPARRYASTRELLYDLRAFLAHMPVVARPLTRTGRLFRRVRRRPAPAIAAAAVLASAAIAVWLTHVSRDLAAQREARYRSLFATLPPTGAIQSHPRDRHRIDPAERERDIAQLTEILELRPDDLYCRLSRAALLLDQARHVEAARDIEWFSTAAPSEYVRAVAARYRDADVDVRGIDAVRIDDLPDPVTATDCLIAGFHLMRARRATDQANELLGRAADLTAARYLRLTTFVTLGLQQARRAEGQELLRTAREQALELQNAGIGETARTAHVIGAAFVGLQNYAAAIAPLRRSLELCPGSHGPMQNLATAYRRLGRTSDAEAIVVRAHARRPWLWSSVFLLAQLRCDQRRFDAAMDFADRLDDDGSTFEPWRKSYLQGRIETERALDRLRGRDRVAANEAASSAIRFFSQCVERGGPRNRAEPQRILASSIREGDNAALLPLYIRALLADPLNSANVQTLAGLLPREGLSPEATLHLEAFLLSLAAAIRPDDPVPGERLERVLQELERQSK